MPCTVFVIGSPFQLREFYSDTAERAGFEICGAFKGIAAGAAGIRGAIVLSVFYLIQINANKPGL